MLPDSLMTFLCLAALLAVFLLFIRELTVRMKPTCWLVSKQAEYRLQCGSGSEAGLGPLPLVTAGCSRAAGGRAAVLSKSGPTDN